MTTLAQRAAARKQIEDQRALAARLLAEMENPTPLKPEVAAKAAAFQAETTRNGWSTDPVADEQKSHYHKPKTVAVTDLNDVIDDDPDTGCMIWTGPYATDPRSGFTYAAFPWIHTFCGHSHFFAARALWEELHSTILDKDTEMVVSQCQTPGCVNPTHFEMKERAA